MKFLIIGRTATGKDTLASILSYKYGWKFVKSMTTRPRRYDTEDTHIFITEEEASRVGEEEKVAYTRINDYDYFATRQQVIDSDAYIIDPKGAEILLKKMPNEKFIIVYLIPKDKTTQRLKAINRGEDISKEEKIFESRYSSEDEQFTNFEYLLDTYRIYNYKNVKDFVRFINTYDSDNMEYFAHSLDTIKRVSYN